MASAQRKRAATTSERHAEADDRELISRRQDDDRELIERRRDEPGRWKFSRTISLDSVIAFVVTLAAGVTFLFSMDNKIDKQELKQENMLELIKRVEKAQEDRMTRAEKDQAERSQRLEAAVKEQGKLIQDYLLPKLNR